MEYHGESSTEKRQDIGGSYWELGRNCGATEMIVRCVQRANVSWNDG